MNRILSFLSSSFLLFLLVVANDAASVRDSEASEPLFKTQDMICHGADNCYPRIFVPTHEFQVVKPDQVIPPGLHVKMDFETGVNQAKFPDENDDTPAQSYEVAIPKENIDGTKVDVAVSEKKVSEPPSLKPNGKIPQDDRTRFHSAMETLDSKTKVSKEDMRDTLSTLAELTHELEYGVEAMKTATVERLLSILDTSKSDQYPKKSREDAAVIIGNSLQNNPNAIRKASELKSSKSGESLNIASALLRSLVDEKDAVVQKRIMFALARSIRVPGSRHDFVNKDGLETLRIIFSKNGDPTLLGKIAAFIEDEFLNDDMMGETEKTLFKAGQPNREKMVSVVNVPQELAKWCPTLQKSLQSAGDDQDMAEKVLRTLTLAKTQFGVECPREDSTLPWLDKHLKQTGNAKDEDDDFVIVMKDAKKAFA